MLNLETKQLNERSLKANFTEVQQRHFDKLMSELEVISGGLGFDELKTKAETGDKKYLQALRDYVDKKEQIVIFIENKEMGDEWHEEELKVGDEVYILKPDTLGEKGTIEYFQEQEDEKPLCSVIYELGGQSRTDTFQGQNLAKVKPEKFDAGRLGEIELLDLKKYEDIEVGDIYESKDLAGLSSSMEIVGFEMPINATSEQGLNIIYIAGNNQLYAKSLKWFRRDSKAGNFKKV